MTFKNNKGITLIALIITFIIMTILLTVGVEEGKRLLEKAKVEDIKTEMLLIQAKAKIVIDKESFGEDYSNEGMLALDLSNNTTGFVLTGEIQSKLQEIVTNDENTKLYIWNEQALSSNSLGEIKIDNLKFYIIDYNTGEIYYSLGYEGNFSLTEIQNIDSAEIQNVSE